MIFNLLLSLIYLFFLFVEFIIVKKEKVNIFHEDNWFFVFASPGTLILAIYVLFYFTFFIVEDSTSSFPIISAKSFFGYYFTFVLGSIFYIIYYIRSKMYALISNNNKSKFYSKPTTIYSLVKKKKVTKIN